MWDEEHELSLLENLSLGVYKLKIRAGYFVCNKVNPYDLYELSCVHCVLTKIDEDDEPLVINMLLFMTFCFYHQNYFNFHLKRRCF